ncbi:putative ribonuclease H-like domain-containing protein [Tanacetum coccineum]
MDNKLEEGERMWNSIEKGPYKRPMIPNPDNTKEQILEPLSKMTEGNKKQYIADVKDMWERIKRLMFSFDVTSHVTHSRLMDEFDKFAAKEGESLDFVYERLTTLVNIMDHNNGDVVSYDELYDSLLQFEPHVLASKAKKAAKNHDPLALLAYPNASSSQSHVNYSYSPQPYYVTHPSSVADYEDEYRGELQGDPQEDKLTTTMMLLARATLRSYDENGNRNARRQTKNQAFNAGNGNDESNQIKPRVRDAKYDREQMLLAMKDEAGSNLKDEENDFMLDNSYGDETMEELTTAVIMMTRIQPADDNVEFEPSYDAKAVSKINASHKVHKQVNHVECKTIIHTSDDDQIDSNIIFDDPYVENNGCTSKHDFNAHDEYHDIQMLAYNVQREAENKKTIKQ